MFHPIKLSLFASLLILAACGEKPAATSAAMKVNGEAISASEVEGKLQQYQHLPAERKSVVAQQILAALADSEMLRQAAVRDKLDQDETVKARLASANRLILANTFIEKSMAAVAKPTEAEVKAYFEQKPERYAERKVYDLQEVVMETSAEKMEEVEARLAGGVKHMDFIRWLQDARIPFNEQHLIASADKVLGPVLEKLRGAREGDVITLPAKDRLSVLFLNAIQTEPLTLAQAAPLIANALYEERKAARMEAMLKQLRDKTRIEYLPPYAAENSAPKQP